MIDKIDYEDLEYQLDDLEDELYDVRAQRRQVADQLENLELEEEDLCADIRRIQQILDARPEPDPDQEELF